MRRKARNSGLQKITWAVVGVTAGALAMYYLDPDRGRRRRALFKDKAIKLRKDSAWYLGKQLRNFNNHLEGWLMEGLQIFRSEGSVDDSTLAQRVRSEMGRAIHHPANVKVSAHQGQVTLQGVVQAQEVDPLFRCVRKVRGVRSVVNQLSLQQGDEPATSVH